jgi:hypothetical protein
MKKIILLVFIFSLLSVFAEKVILLSEAEIFQLVNTKTKKIYPYYLLQPQASIRLQVRDLDSLEILSRQIITSNSIEYQYAITVGETNQTISKTARISAESRGVSGEKISTFNKQVIPIENQQELIVIKNSSPHRLIIKFDADKYSRQYRPVEFLAFTPHKFGDEITLSIDDNMYAYFSPNSSDIELTLEGPMQFKIISRLMFEDTFTSRQTYRYQVAVNGKSAGEYLETAVKSSKANIVNDSETGVSTGSTETLNLPKGIHNIRISAPDNNRNVIFRFFINKNAIGR